MKKTPATVTRVVPSKIVIILDGVVERFVETGNYVEVTEDKTGITHTLINGSINQTSPEDRAVGTKGWIVWISGTNFNLPHFVTS